MREDDVRYDPNTKTYAGGSLLSRRGIVCDASAFVFERPFDETYWCHVQGATAVHYLKYIVVVASACVVLATARAAFAMRRNFLGFEAWRRARDARDDAEGAAAAGSRRGGGGGETEPIERAPLFKATRGVLRMLMYYVQPTPPGGDLPTLISRAVFGATPRHDEIARIGTYCMMTRSRAGPSSFHFFRRTVLYVFLPFLPSFLRRNEDAYGVRRRGRDHGRAHELHARRAGRPARRARRGRPQNRPSDGARVEGRGHAAVLLGRGRRRGRDGTAPRRLRKRKRTHGGRYAHVHGPPRRGRPEVSHGRWLRDAAGVTRGAGGQTTVTV